MISKITDREVLQDVQLPSAPIDWCVLQGDAVEVLAGLPDRSVNCCVTSPPYYGLRDYGTGRWEGGNPSCEHKLSPTMRNGRSEDRPLLSGSVATNSYQLVLAHNSVCGTCGAVKVDDQIGLERTPDEYIARLVDVFREVRRVLADDGVLWVNIGDSYAMSTKGSSGKGEKQITNAGTLLPDRKWRIPEGLKPKDLIGIPWMLAFALRADGWYLRQDIIWAKPNPMPESVKDRCTKAHEYVFMLSKSAKYFYDSAAIAEAAVNGERFHGDYGKPGVVKITGDRNGRHDSDNTTTTRNRRSVWTITPKPYRDAHFATFPPELPNLCIRSSCPIGGTVLDPFTGSGTTGMVAVSLGRSFIGVELNPDYIAMAERRITEGK